MLLPSRILPCPIYQLITKSCCSCQREWFIYFMPPLAGTRASSKCSWPRGCTPSAGACRPDPRGSPPPWPECPRSRRASTWRRQSDVYRSGLSQTRPCRQSAPRRNSRWPPGQRPPGRRTEQQLPEKWREENHKQSMGK